MPDILFVPGGFGVVPAMEDAETSPGSARSGEQAQWVTARVHRRRCCSARRGCSQGYRATTHWASHHYLALFGASRCTSAYVFDRNRVTGGGVTAGIDFALALIAAIRGDDMPSSSS